jgi:hypothetical protein
MDKYPPLSDGPSLPLDHKRIAEAAASRAHFLLWLAEKILVSSDVTLRKTISKELRQLAEGK